MASTTNRAQTRSSASYQYQYTIIMSSTVAIINTILLFPISPVRIRIPHSPPQSSFDYDLARFVAHRLG
jgi:hypothetical protein